MFADWAKERLGLEIPELANPDPVKIRNKPIQPPAGPELDQPALF